jgi:hypothetical protein
MQELLSAIPSEAVSGTRVSAAVLAQCKYSFPFILEGCYSQKVTRTVLLPMKQVEREDSNLIACSLKNYIPICTSIHGVCLV